MYSLYYMGSPCGFRGLAGVRDVRYILTVDHMTMVKTALN